MIVRSRFALMVPIVSVFLGMAGCAAMNRKFDMASERMHSQKPVYEGRLVSYKAVGALVSLQFKDGQQYDVHDAPSTLVAGDIVRIYKTEKGYEAHLWRASQESLIPPPAPPAKPKTR